MSGAQNEHPTEDGHVETARLDKDAEEKLVQRLYYRQIELAQRREEERVATLRRSHPLCGNKTLSKGDEERLVERMYDQQLQRHAATKDERERKADEEVHKRDIKLDGSDIDDQVKRMYEAELAKSHQRREERDQRYYPKQESKKLPKSELGAAVNRLYHVDYEKRDEELFKKHVYPFDPKTTRVSRSNEAAMADRLSTTKGTV